MDIFYLTRPVCTDSSTAFQTAIALAEYDGETDEEGKIVVTDSHFRAIVELSKDFKDYLNELHRGDEAKRAARKYERLDTFAAPVRTGEVLRKIITKRVQY